MGTITESLPSGSSASQIEMGVITDKWLQYSQVYERSQFLLFDELGWLTNGKKRDGRGGTRSSSGPIYPSYEAAEVLYANITPGVPIRLTSASESCMEVISDYLKPQACQAVRNYELGTGDGTLFEGYVNPHPKGKGMWVYVTSTTEIPFKECWIKLEKCDERVGQKVQEVEDELSTIVQSSQLQTKKQSSILQFFSKIPKDAFKKPVENRHMSPKFVRLASSRKKRKCTQMHVTPISKPKRKLPRRKMTWSPINETCLSPSPSSSPLGTEHAETSMSTMPTMSTSMSMMPRPQSPCKIDMPLVKAEIDAVEDSQIDPTLKLIRKSLIRTKLLREKYSKVFDANRHMENGNEISISDLRNRFHAPITTCDYSVQALETPQDELPEDLLLDIFSMEEDSYYSVNNLTHPCTSSSDFLFSLLPDNVSLSYLISFDDFNLDDAVQCEAADDFMEDGFHNGVFA